MGLRNFIDAQLISFNPDTMYSPASLTVKVYGETQTLPFARDLHDEHMPEMSDHLSAVLKPGDAVRYSRYDSLVGGEKSIAYVMGPRPMIDAVTLDYLRRAGANMREVVERGRDVAWLWSLEDDGSEFEIAIADGRGVGRRAASDGIRLCNQNGTIVIQEMHYGEDGNSRSSIELHGPNVYLTPTTAASRFAVEELPGRRLGDITPLPLAGCFLSGDEIIETVVSRPWGWLVTLVSGKVPLDEIVERPVPAA